MKFAHLSDCHLGAHRDLKLRDANTRSFIMAIDKCMEEKVDFVLIAGDLFDTAVPVIDILKIAMKQLKRLKNAKIPVYLIAGSHDFSPSGKTMLDILEEANLAVNVARCEPLPNDKIKLLFTIDEKTGAKITGIPGRKGGLDKAYYYHIAREFLEKEQGFKIFMFHGTIDELKTRKFQKVEGMALSLMPEGFDYYAGGHLHFVRRDSFGKYKNAVYPGPIFPNSFDEIEDLKHGSFAIFEDGNIKIVSLPVNPVVCITVDAEQKTPSEVEAMIKKQLSENDLTDAIVAIRVFGCLRQGKTADIRWNDIYHDCYSKKAFCVKHNANALTSREMEVIMVKEANVEEVEDSLLKQHASQFKLSTNDVELAKKLMHCLSAEKAEGERNADFEARVHSELDKLFG
ncbi:MAG: exonuclease SbcCD subunit D [Candidatus Woesearchaeota archaeon]